MVGGSTSATSDREIVVTRIIEGPRPLVFEAYTDPRHLAHWWGPNGFTTTTDAFNAVAEPQRRRILTLLKGRERSVNELAGALRVSQTRVSKHLRVLRVVGLVSVREAGQQRLYQLEARGLKPIHDWVGGFEEFWSQSFDRLNAYVKRLQRKGGG